jgi:hypothetical protein
MNTEDTDQPYVQISPEKLLAFVRAMTGGSAGYPDDEHPLPPGPWDPVIRSALEAHHVFGPHPEPWDVFSRGGPSRTRGPAFAARPEAWKAVLASILARHPEIWDAIGGGHSFGDDVALNPQPLPPRYAVLLSVAQAVIFRAELLQEIAGAIQTEGEERGIIIVSGYIDRFVDDFCGNGFRLKWPFPGPRPHWYPKELDGFDLVVIATQFEQAAKEAYSLDFRQVLAGASAKFVEAGLAKM